MSSARLDRLAVLGLLICFIVRLRAEPGDPGNKGHFLLHLSDVAHCEVPQSNLLNIQQRHKIAARATQNLATSQCGLKARSQKGLMGQGHRRLSRRWLMIALFSLGCQTAQQE